MSSAFENPYLLLTPGPLSTSPGVRRAMQADWCTWDVDYKQIVQDIRARLLSLTGRSGGSGYTSVLMQGSGTFSVEAAIGTFVPRGGRLLVLVNGAYGRRIVRIAEMLGIDFDIVESTESRPIDPSEVQARLDSDETLRYVAVVHCETTTGLLNPIEEIAPIVHERNRLCIVDAMSSFGGVPIDLEALGIDVLVSSANKCIQGVPGFGFVVCRRSLIDGARGNARSLSLDLTDQWETFEHDEGKWRFTSPTHVVRAFQVALSELEEEGGVESRFERYRQNRDILVAGIERLGLRCFVAPPFRSPIITAICAPDSPNFAFQRFYDGLKQRGFVIYPGKVSEAETFRIGTIGHVFPDDMWRLVSAIEELRTW